MKKRWKGEEESSLARICEDIHPLILSKLPARSICRFRCVSKSWLALFQDEDFISKTRSKPPFELEIKHGNRLHYFCVDETGLAKAKGRNLLLSYNSNSYRRCNNLICFPCERRDLFPKTTGLCLLHLSTGDRRYLPLLPSPSSSNLDDTQLALSFEVGFDPVSVPFDFSFEFGFDPVSKSYKVLALPNTKNSEFHVLTLGTTSWRPLQNVPKFTCCEKSLATTTGMFYLVHGSEVVSFNLATEKFRTIQLPTTLQSDPSIYDSFTYSTFEYDGCFCWVEQPTTSSQHKKSVITGIWMLKDVDNNTWVRVMMRTNLPVDVPYFYFSSGSTSWLCKHSHFSSTRSGEIMITTCNGQGRSILLYNFLDHQFRKINISGELPDHTSNGHESCREL